MMLLLVFVALPLLVLYYTTLFSYWDRRGVKAYKGPPTLNFVKLLTVRRKCKVKHMKRLYDTFRGEPVYGKFSFSSPVLVLRDLDLAKKVIVRDCGANFSARNVGLRLAFCPLVRSNLYNSSGSCWKTLRFTLAPVFSYAARTGAMLELMKGPCRRLRTSLPDGPATVVAADKLMHEFSADLLAATVFGLDLEDPRSLEDFLLHAEVLSEHFLAADGCSSSLVACVAQLFHPYDVKASEKFFLAAVSGATEPTSEETGKTFVQLLLEANAPRSCDRWVNVQACSFVVLGLRPLRLLLTSALMELARNKEVQDRLREEIRATEEIAEMEYLDRVVAETLRKWPPVLELVRETTQASTLPGTCLQLEAHTKVTVPVFAIHRDPEHFPDPERFDPDRFNDDDNLRRHSCGYLPFGDGPRNCIGMRFAILSAKACLATILKDLEFETCDEKKPGELDPFSYPEGKTARLRVHRAATP